MFYYVNDRQFTNKFIAAHYAATSKGNLKFNLYESAFDAVDWSREPDLSWDSLLDIRANQIAAKNKPIVLFFSGGTDSYTIYKVFERNNIHIDVAYIRTWDTEKYEQRSPLQLMNQGWYDKNTKMVFCDGNDLIKNRSYLTPNWIWEESTRPQYGITGAGDSYSNKEISQLLGTDDFISVLGFEKPRLHFDSSGVYSYQDDENYIRCIGDPRFDCFYISPDLPELHVKQSYMLLKYIKSLKPTDIKIDDPLYYQEFNNVHVPSDFPWLKYSINGCGRFGDLNKSEIGHLTHRYTQLILPKHGIFNNMVYAGKAEVLWNTLKSERTFKNYIHGFISVALDAAGKYLMTNPRNAYSMRKHQSKFYKMNLNG